MDEERANTVGLVPTHAYAVLGMFIEIDDVRICKHVFTNFFVKIYGRLKAYDCYK